MPQTSNIRQYDDVREQLAEFLHGNGGKIEFDTYGQAVVWRARAYKFRTLLRDQQRDPDLPTYIPSTPYDTMILSLDQKAKDTVVHVIFHRPKSGRIKLNDIPAPEVNLITTPEGEIGDALAEAEAMIKGL